MFRLLTGEMHLDSRDGQTDSWPSHTANHSAANGYALLRAAVSQCAGEGAAVGPLGAGSKHWKLEDC